jgi:hypothetical protein
VLQSLFIVVVLESFFSHFMVSICNTNFHLYVSSTFNFNQKGQLFIQAIMERRVIRVSPNTWEMLINNMIEIQQRQAEADQRLAQLEQKQIESE